MEDVNDVYIVHDVGDKNPPIRFAVEDGKGKYIIFSYFPVGNDSSLSVKHYYSSDHTWMEKINFPPDQLLPDHALIDISEGEKKAVQFEIHKHTFHKSGVMNAKDKMGNRMDNDSDIESIPFDAINCSIRLCYVIPTVYSAYPKVDCNTKKYYNVFNLNDSARNMPSVIEIRLCKKDFNINEKMKEVYTGFIAFVDSHTLESKDIDIYTVFHKSNNDHFPRTPLFIKEFY